MKEAELTSYEKKHRINRETSSDQQCNEGSVEIKRRKQTDSRERKIVFKRERPQREKIRISEEAMGEGGIPQKKNEGEETKEILKIKKRRLKIIKILGKLF